MPTFSVTQQTSTVGIDQIFKMTIAMDVPSEFSAVVTFGLTSLLANSTATAKPCTIVFQSAGENVGSSDPQCVDPNLSRRAYTPSINSTHSDYLSYDYGVISNMGSRSTTYSSQVNTIV